MKSDCNIVKDMMPLYIDEICSQETAKYVEEHLDECSECRETYELLKNTDLVVENTEKKEIHALQRVEKYVAGKIMTSHFLFVTVLVIGILLLMLHARTISVVICPVLMPLVMLFAGLVFGQENQWSSKRNNHRKIIFGIQAVLLLYCVGIMLYMVNALNEGIQLFEFLPLGFQPSGINAAKVGPFLATQLKLVVFVSLALLISHCYQVNRKKRKYSLFANMGILTIFLGLSYHSMLYNMATAEDFYKLLVKSTTALVVIGAITTLLMWIISKIHTKKRQKVMIALLAGAVLLAGGGLLGTQYFAQKQFTEYQSMEEAVEDFSYGVKENHLSVTDISWKDYPGWKTVEFRVSGTFTAYVPKGAEVLPEGVNSDAVRETARTTFALTNSQELTYYDEVTYEIVDSVAEGKVIEEWSMDSIMKAVNNFQWKLLYSWENENGETLSGQYIIGCILPMDDEMQFWSEEQNRYAGRKLEAYLDAFRMSRTYVDESAQTTKDMAEDILLKKREGGVFCFELINNSNEKWQFYPVLPELELWYDGIWIEVESLYADMSSWCDAGETKVVEKPEREGEYPYLFPGLYRLVYYGLEDEYVTSEVFEVR